MKYFIPLFLTLLLWSCGTQDTIGNPPTDFVLSQNFPNPFTDTTVIVYGVPQSLKGQHGPTIRLIVKDRFNIKLRTLKEGSNYPAILDTAVWDGRGANNIKAISGIYYIELQRYMFSDENTGWEVLKRVVALKQ